MKVKRRCRTNGRLSDLPPCLVAGKGGLNEFGVQPGVGLAQSGQYRWQFNQSAYGRLLQQANSANHGQAALLRCVAPGAVIHQHCGGMDFLGETNGLHFTGINVEWQREHFGCLHGNPGRQRGCPLTHEGRRVWLLHFAEYGRRNHDLAEQPGQHVFRVAQNQVVQW